MEASNVKAMREVLVGLAQAVQDFMATKGRNFYPDMAVALEAAAAALSAPPRNCDVGTAKEQSDRFYRFCNSHFVPSRSGGSCKKCPLWGQRENCSCQFFWANLPYMGEDGEREGGN